RPFLRQTLPTATRRIERLTARFITLRILFELSIIFLDIFLFVTHNTSRINFKYISLLFLPRAKGKPMSIGSVPNQEVHVVDALALLVAKIGDHLRREPYAEAATRLEIHSASAWFGFQPTRAVEVLQLLVAQTPAPRPILKAIIGLMTATT